MLARLGKISPAYQRLLLIAICAVLFCLWLSWMPLTQIDEARFCAATREMMHSGNYLIPTFNHEPRYQKPILYYWIQSVSLRFFGQTEAAARFPSAVAAILLVLMIHWFLLRWLPSRARQDALEGQAAARGAALLGALSVATVPLMMLWARAATTDMSLTLFVSATVLPMFHADLLRVTTTGSEKTVRNWYLLSAITAALAFLTKGPVGVIIPALVWLSYHALQRDLLLVFRRTPWAMMLGLFILISAPWYIATYLVDGPAFLKHFFMTENIGRFTTVMEGHGASSGLWGRLQELIVYWPITLIGLFPYSAFLLHEAFAPFAGNRTLRGDDVLVRIRRFAWCWLLAIIVLFSLSRTQLPSYIQSILGAAGILFAVHVLGRLSVDRDAAAAQRPAMPPPTNRWGMVCEVALLTLIGSALIYFLNAGLLKNGINMNLWAPPAPMPHGEALLMATLLGSSGGLFVLGALLWGMRRRPAPFIAWVMTTWTLVFAVLVLGIGPLAVRSNYRLMALAGASLRALPSEMRVFAYFGTAPETLVYYAQRQIELCSLDEENFLQRLAKVMEKDHLAYVVTDQAGLATVMKHYTAQPIQQFGPSILIVYVTEMLPDAVTTERSAHALPHVIR